MRLHHKRRKTNKRTNLEELKLRKFSIWYKKVSTLATKNNYKNWEKRGNWKAWWDDGLTPKVALTKLDVDSF